MHASLSWKLWLYKHILNIYSKYKIHLQWYIFGLLTLISGWISRSPKVTQPLRTAVYDWTSARVNLHVLIILIKLILLKIIPNIKVKVLISQRLISITTIQVQLYQSLHAKSFRFVHIPAYIKTNRYTDCIYLMKLYHYREK